jgi:Na+/proline symporter
MVIILIFAFTAYASGDKIGSVSKMYELLVEAARVEPIEGNAGGSFLTMKSEVGGVFGIINIIGNLATVFLDQGALSSPCISPDNEKVTFSAAFLSFSSRSLLSLLAPIPVLSLLAACCRLPSSDHCQGLPPRRDCVSFPFPFALFAVTTR